MVEVVTLIGVGEVTTIYQRNRNREHDEILQMLSCPIIEADDGHDRNVLVLGPALLRRDVVGNGLLLFGLAELALRHHGVSRVALLVDHNVRDARHFHRGARLSLG